MDGRHKRRDKTGATILRALDRLQKGEGTHPRHAGISVRLTRQAVVREARISSATLYRYPEILVQLTEAIEAETDKQQQRAKPSEQRRKQFVETIAKLEGDRSMLLAENFRLTRELAKYDPRLGLSDPIQLDSKRSQKRTRPAIK
jgi:hypothetical protein